MPPKERLPRDFRVQDLESLIDTTGDYTVTDMANRAGVSRTVWSRYRRDGLDMWEADAIATAFDLYPASVWPHWDNLCMAEMEDRTMVSEREQRADAARAALATAAEELNLAPVSAYEQLAFVQLALSA